MQPISTNGATHRHNCALILNANDNDNENDDDNDNDNDDEDDNEDDNENENEKKDFVPLCLCAQLINPCFRAAPYQGAQNVQKMPLMPP